MSCRRRATGRRRWRRVLRQRRSWRPRVLRSAWACASSSIGRVGRRARRRSTGATLDIAEGVRRDRPDRVDSDVRTAGRAEALLGAGRDFSRLVFLNVGTGISYCLLRDGVPDPGARGYAIIVGAPAVEDVAGGAGLAALAGEPDARAVLANPRHAALVAEAAAALGGGDRGARERARPRCRRDRRRPRPRGMLPRRRGRGRAPADLGRGRAGHRRSSPAELGGDGAILGAALAAPAAAGDG